LTTFSFSFCLERARKTYLDERTVATNCHSRLAWLKLFFQKLYKWFEMGKRWPFERQIWQIGSECLNKRSIFFEFQISVFGHSLLNKLIIWSVSQGIYLQYYYSFQRLLLHRPVHVLLDDLLKRLFPWTFPNRSWMVHPIWARRAQHSTGLSGPWSAKILLRSVDPRSVGQPLMFVVVHLRIVRTYRSYKYE